MSRLPVSNLAALLSVVLLVATLALIANAQSQTRIQGLNQGQSQRGTLANQAVAPTWEYARLVADRDLFSFHAGDTNVIPDVVTVDVIYRRLGGTFRPNLTNLLNQIGRDGWELVATDESIWTFKRQR